MEQSLNSKLQYRGLHVERCEVSAGEGLFVDGETVYKTELAYNVTPLEPIENTQEYTHWHSAIQLFIKADAQNAQEVLKYSIVYEAGCEFRYSRDADEDKDYDWFLKQVERVGLSTLISSARSHMQGVIGLLGYPTQFVMPMIDIAAMIKAHHTAEQEETSQD